MPPSSIASLLSVADVDGIVKSGALRVDRVSVARDGDLLPKTRYGADPDDPSSHVATDRLQLLLSDGHTVILNGLQECLPSIAEICNRISFELGVGISANAYLTPPNSKGFGHHYDLHSVLIVQTSGSKTWNLFPPALVDPIEEQGRREWGWLPPEFLERDIKKGLILRRP
jgi:bifunctional lysine-specific demethylase and histidyl-hydroxylase NO66